MVGPLREPHPHRPATRPGLPPHSLDKPLRREPRQRAHELLVPEPGARGDGDVVVHHEPALVRSRVLPQDGQGADLGGVPASYELTPRERVVLGRQAHAIDPSAAPFPGCPNSAYDPATTATEPVPAARPRVPPQRLVRLWLVPRQDQVREQQHEPFTGALRARAAELRA